MAKSVYSLVLNDDVMNLVDLTAQKIGISRSALINKILSESLGLETVEKRINDVFSVVERMIGEHRSMRFAQSGVGGVVIKSAIAFKYNPTVNYSVVLYKGDENYVGELRVTLRTTNEQLIRLVDEFFSLFVSFEQKYLDRPVVAEISHNKFLRLLKKPEFIVESSMIGEMITNFISNLDEMIKLYFSLLGDKNIVRKLENFYIKNVKPYTVI